MDFTTMGTIGSYLRQKNLKFAANYKINTGQKVTDANGGLDFAETKTTASDRVDTKKRSDKEISAARLASIKQKLANGRRLSDEELSYLRSREPKTYKKAKNADEAREDLKSELKKAKTKQEARQAVTQAMIRASTKASADISGSKSDSDSSGAKTDLNSADGLSNALNSTFAENWGYNAETTNFDERGTQIAEVEEENPFADYDFNFNSSENNFADSTETQLDADENIFSDSDINFNPSQKNSKTSTEEQNSEQDSPQEVMESFIMTIRALEATWAEFTKSKEYEELPDNQQEEMFLRSIGEDKKQKTRYKELQTPRAKNLNAVAAYRNSMMFRNSQFILDSS